MSRVALACALAVLAAGAARTAAAQEHPDVQAIRQAYQGLRYDSVIARAHRAIVRAGLPRADLVTVYELLAYTYGAMDSAQRAVDAFRELIRLDPDREPDPARVAPRITSLYASALGQVVVLRKVVADTGSFIAGQGGYDVHFQVSRPARVTARVVGAGVDTLVDSVAVVGDGAITWRGLAHGGPVAPGTYQLVLDAASGREEFERAIPLAVTRGAVDTLPHVTRLEGYDERPETVSPPRSIAPLGRVMLYLVGGIGAALAVENSALGTEQRTGIGIVSGAALGSALLASLRRPAPEPVEANIAFNRLLREQIARRNAEIAAQNAQLLRQVQIRVAPAARRGT